MLRTLDPFRFPLFSIAGWIESTAIAIIDCEAAALSYRRRQSNEIAQVPRPDNHLPARFASDQVLAARLPQ
jgi:hypothetical protein